ncbi:MAG: hypothetical protein ACJ768_01460 [Gaiellaceae bacterium]
MFDALGTGGARAPELEAPAPPLGRLLVERGHVTEEQLQGALAEHARTGLPLGQVLVSLSYVTAATVAQALATQQGGLVKTEYGLATGFGTPGLVAFPPVSPPAAQPLTPSWIEAKPKDEPAKAEAPEAEALPLRVHEVIATPAGPDPRLAAAQERVDELELELAAAVSTGSSLEAAEERIQSLEAELATARMEAARVPALEVDLAAARQAEAERDAHLLELQRAKAALEATQNELAAYAADRAAMIESLRAAHDRVHEVETTAIFQQPRTASPFAWQS